MYHNIYHSTPPLPETLIAPLKLALNNRIYEEVSNNHRSKGYI